jgi:PAS domain S-box-containing protein/diguanylate cyclase (GGDEF)-like protein
MPHRFAKVRVIGPAVLKLVASSLMLGVPAMLLANMYLAATPDSLLQNRTFITTALVLLALGGTVMLWFEINQRAKAERLIEDQSEVLRRQALIAANMDNMVVITNKDGLIEWCNAGFTRISGYQAHEVQGKPIGDILQGPRQITNAGQLMESARRDGHGFRSELLLYTRDGREYWADINVQPLLDKSSKLAGHVALMLETTKRKQQEQELEHVAYYDSLTNLPNRALLLKRLRLALQDHETRPGLIYLKFPRMTALRGTLGHGISDELTLTLVNHIKQHLAEGHLLARLSASAFVILVTVKRPGEALSVAYALQSVMAKPYHVADREIHMVTSIGVAVAAADLDDATSLLRDAEIASQAVSTKSMDEVVLFDVAMRQQLEARHKLETDLRRAIYFDSAQLAVVFQPIVDIKDLRLLGFETLARWKHPERGWIPPDQFIGIAEETGMIVPLWNFVFAEACRYLVRWQRMRPANVEPLFVSVNLSATQFFYPGLMRSVSAVIDVTRVDPSWIKFEITESGLMENAAAALQQMESLKSLGCTLAIDDFGTGYSSLSYLQKLPVDDIKIDKSFIMNMNKSSSSREIVRIVTELGRILNKRVIAEGIETEYDLHVLRQLNCECGQGFYFYKPMMPEAAEALVLEKTRELLEGEAVIA